MNTKILAVLRFLRVTDESDRLSLTNIALVVAVVYLLRRPELSVQDLLAFAAALGAYQFKRWAQPDTTAADESAELKKALAELQTKVTAIQAFRK
jgi:sugar phosphate isomerase/epimerase